MTLVIFVIRLTIAVSKVTVLEVLDAVAATAQIAQFIRDVVRDWEVRRGRKRE